jgi:hypothetical protein
MGLLLDDPRLLLAFIADVVVFSVARETASQIGDGLTRIQRRHDASPRGAASAVTVGAESNRGNQRIPPCGGSLGDRTRERCAKGGRLGISREKEPG